MEEYTPSWLEGSSSPRDDFHIPEVPESDPMPPPPVADPVVDVEMLETQGDSVDLSALASSAAPDMPEQAVSDPMQVGSILGSLITAFDPASEEHMQDRHIGFMNSVYQLKDRPTYKEEVELCGTKVMLHFPGYVISDVDGTHLSCDQSWEGMKVEVGSMSLQEVGRVLKQNEATQLCKENGILRQSPVVGSPPRKTLRTFACVWLLERSHVDSSCQGLANFIPNIVDRKPETHALRSRSPRSHNLGSRRKCSIHGKSIRP